MTTRSLTQGALTIALSAVLLIIARQFATTIDVFVGWLLPLPLIVYGARFKPSYTGVVLSSIILLSLIISPFVSALYFLFYFLHGALFGMGLFLKWSRQQLFISSLVSMMLVTLFSVGLFSTLFGIDLIAEYNMVLAQLTNMINSSGATLPAGFDLGRIALISVVMVYVFTVIIEGWLVYLMGLLLVSRLKIIALPPRLKTRFQLPVWAGVFALLMLIPYPYLVATNSETFLIPAISLYVFGATLIVYNALNFVIIFKRTLKFKYFYLLLILLFLILPSIWLDMMLIVGLLDSFVNLRQRWLGALSND